MKRKEGGGEGRRKVWRSETTDALVWKGAALRRRGRLSEADELAEEPPHAITAGHSRLPLDAFRAPSGTA